MADRFVPLARQRPLEHECRGDECPEVAVGELRGSFVHETIVAAPSDTRSAGRTRRCDIALREPWAVSPSSRPGKGRGDRAGALQALPASGACSAPPGPVSTYRRLLQPLLRAGV